MKRGFKAKLRYRMDEFIGGGAGKQLLFLFLLTMLIVALFTGIGFALHLGSGDATATTDRLHETAWWFFTRVLDPGTMSGDGGLLNRAISTSATVLGVVVAGLLISALAGNFQERLESIRRGGAAVMEERHFLILGWSEKIFSVIDQLAEAYAAEGRICCVVMAERDKISMEESLQDKIQYKNRVKLVVRSGSSVNLQDLEKVSFAHARAIVVLLDEADTDNPDKADARIMKTLMALFNHPSLKAASGQSQSSRKALRVTAEVMQSQNQELALIASSGLAHVVKTNEMISKVILQTARISGLSLVYDELLRFEGNEIHMKFFPQVVGKQIGDILLDFPNALVVGVTRKDGSGHQLNPPADHVVSPNEELLLLAEDANIRYQVYQGPLRNIPLPELSASSNKPVEHLLILGWNEKVFPMLKEFDDYVASGSTVTLVNTLPADVRDAAIQKEIGQVSNIAIRHLVGQFTSRALMEQLGPHHYPNVMVLGDAVEEKTAEAADTRAIIALLLLRDLRERHGANAQRVCSEILDPKNRELAATTEINDIVISNEMVSMVLAQITYEPRVQAVLEDLLRSEGSEIYLKPVSFYSPAGQAVTFEYLVLLAKARGELALGLQRYAEDPDGKFGLRLNPVDRATPFVPGPQDRLIVLAEEDG